MRISLHKKFIKSYAKLDIKRQRKVKKTLEVFEKNPFEKSLLNHFLKGKLEGKRAISAGGDLRIIFEEKGNYTEILFLHVGSHSQVY